jgi:hypothetical protein
VVAGLEIDTNMKIRRTLMSTQLMISGATATAIVALGLLVVAGALSPRSFAISCLAVMVASALAWFTLLKGKSNSEGLGGDASSPQTQNNLRSKHILAAGLLLWLVLGFWITRGGPWVPRLIGASVVLLVLLAIVLRRPR